MSASTTRRNLKSSASYSCDLEAAFDKLRSIVISGEPRLIRVDEARALLADYRLLQEALDRCGKLSAAALAALYQREGEGEEEDEVGPSSTSNA